MPRLSDNLPIKNEKLDRRVKLTKTQKAEICRIYFDAKIRAHWKLLGKGVSQRTLAKEYGVSRRTIVFVLYPERRLTNLEKRKIRGGWKQYYNKQTHADTQREHRNYKRKLYLNGLLGQKLPIDNQK